MENRHVEHINNLIADTNVYFLNFDIKLKPLLFLAYANTQLTKRENMLFHTYASVFVRRRVEERALVLAVGLPCRTAAGCTHWCSRLPAITPIAACHYNYHDIS